MLCVRSTGDSAEEYSYYYNRFTLFSIMVHFGQLIRQKKIRKENSKKYLKDNYNKLFHVFIIHMNASATVPICMIDCINKENVCKKIFLHSC